FELIESVDGEIHRVGGSHAQWELFEETMVACQLRLGRLADAQRLIRRRLGFRRSPRDLAWLERATARRLRNHGRWTRTTLPGVMRECPVKTVTPRAAHKHGRA